MRRTAFVLAVAVLIPAPAAATRPRTVRRHVPPSQTRVETISAPSFVAIEKGVSLRTTYPWLQMRASSPHGDGATIIAPVHLPDGAQITELEIDFCNGATNGGELTGGVMQLCTTGEACGDGTAATLLWNAAPPNQCARISRPVSPRQIPPIDNATSLLYAQLLVAPGCTSGEGCFSFRSLRITYRLTAAPAPERATFSDVLPGDPLFRWVEALARAGGDVGCGEARYCPDQELTKGEIAMILARVFGIGW